MGVASRRSSTVARLLMVTMVVALAGATACSSGSEEPSAEPGPTTSDTATDDTASDDTVVRMGDPDGSDPLPALSDDVAPPLVFVHGFAGSAQQFESQAMRFVANGYPQERIIAYDHDGAGVDIAAYSAGLAEVVDAALADFGAEQVNLVGHSRGTMVSSRYLSDPANAEKVAKYVAIDGAPCPDVVPCIEVTQDRLPGQAHVEVATSEESFELQYEFLVGDAPEVVSIEAQREPVVLSGRAVNFPANTGRGEATLDIWAIESSTGQRIGDEPHASFELDEDGGFGPVEVVTGGHYEFSLTAEGSPVEHHLYLPPYLRSSDLVRLLSSQPDSSTRTNTNVGEQHSAIVAMRMREWYAEDDADIPGDQTDVLLVGVDDGEPADVMTDFVGNGAIGLHLHDDAASPGESSLEPLPYFSEQPFQSGIDVLMPASTTAEGTIVLTNLPRGDADRAQTFAVPNWPSAAHSISVVFSDHPVG
jgi:pimeloyl-ACP methyl ester carboxylesterase